MKDRTEQKFGYFYYEEEPGQRSAAKLLTKDDARRIAADVAKLPVLLRGLLSQADLLRASVVDSDVHFMSVDFLEGYASGC